MYNKTIIRFGSADNTYLDLAYSEYHGKNFIQWLLSVTPLASGLETSVHNDVARATQFLLPYCGYAPFLLKQSFPGPRYAPHSIQVISSWTI